MEPVSSLIAGAGIGAVFQEVLGIFIRLTKKGLQFKEKLTMIMEKVQLLDPSIKELAELMEELNMSRFNKDILKGMNNVKKTLEKLEDDSQKRHMCWKYPSNTNNLANLDKALDFLLNFHNSVALRAVLVANNRQRGSVAPAVATGYGCCKAPLPLKFDVGLDGPLGELRAEVLSKDQDRPVVVVTALPGCGKTTLVQKLCDDDQIRGRFGNNIMFVKVSKTPNLSDIVGKIHEHWGRNVTGFNTEEDAHNSLERLLSDVRASGPVLLVLDDVWSEPKTLIDKFLFNIPNYKILVTSRFEFQKFKPSFNLKMLNNEEAIDLFLHYANFQANNKSQKALVEEVVKYCKNCPLALKLAGSSLCGESLEIWKMKLAKWSKRDSSVLDDKELLLCLKSSLDFLGEKDEILKNCFIDLGSFPEDRRIPMTALTDIWTELYGIQENIAAAYLFLLNSMNMATVVVTRRDIDEDDGYYSEHFLTLHDMLRELAIYQSKQESEKIKRLFMELQGSNLANSANDSGVRLLSISTDELLSPKWRSAQLSETEILVLNFLKEDQVLPEFVQGMNQLKVLILTNYGLKSAVLSNFHLVHHLTNLKKIRLERVEIPSFKSVKLDNLQKLSLFMCKVSKSFSSINNISEAFPNVEELNIDYCGDLVQLPNGLYDMVNMKKLSVTHCHKLASLPEEIGKRGNIEVLRLRCCIDLKELPDSICELYKLNTLDISDCFSIRNLPEDIGKLGSLTKLNVKGCSRLHELPPSVLDLKELKEVVCDEEIKELWELYLPRDTEIELTLPKEDINLNFLYK